jgi:quinol monooxygenase YgiN
MHRLIFTRGKVVKSREEIMAGSDEMVAEIRQLARYEIHPEAMERVKAAIREFVDYVRSNEPGTLRYDVWQDQEHPTRFVHIFIFRDHAAHDQHSASAQVKKFADVLYPQCLAPVEFIDYQKIASKSTF